MFTYPREDEITILYEELEKYKSVGNEPTLEEQLKNLSINKRETVKRIEEMIADLIEDKRLMEKAYNLRIQDEKTAEARLENKHLIEEYHMCLARAVEIGESNIITANFSLNDYTEHRNVRGVFKKHLHMAAVGLERINRQTS